ncbi:bifunctional RNase H/acid phosphatase [Nocardioides caldifontis]|uniref:bifunctional RNase H/acid phosphatase n=1 Tax=Nocardioides caldifontis TaxID=2588938 RepID=UPI0011DFF772|nr:bifunctional RNase H/acid phosphatase [Nocardioides caldifontis]
MAAYRAVVAEADGGSRGNPGNAAYGAVLKDADTGAVIAERAERIGVATNNVAEYRGLIAALELYHEHAEGAELEVRMDSKLVVEQMRGNWKIKHPSMKPLAIQANRLVPPVTTFTWVPRERNKHADRLANEALDGPEGVVIGGHVPADTVTVAAAEEADRQQEDTGEFTPPWEQGSPTTLVLVRHGDTAATKARVFSGRTGADPGLDDDGRAQLRATADWLAPLAERSPVLLSSPLRRTRESADILAARFELGYEVDDGLVEAGFGAWEGLTYQEVVERDQERFLAWLADPGLPAGGTGDSLTGMVARMAETRDRILEKHRGRTVVALTHLTPIQLLTLDVLQSPLKAVFRTEVAPGSVTVLAWYPDGRPVVRLLNGQPGPMS